MSKVYIFFADGFEDIEGLTVVDLMRRAGIDIQTVSIKETKEIRTSHGIDLLTDRTFGECDFSDADMLVIPGGMPGTKYLEKYKSTPNQRLELDASRDATALLHRQTSPNYKTSLTVPIRKLYLGEKIVVKAIIDAGIVSGGERERKVSVTYWNGEEMDYKSGVFYIADIEYTISHVNERKLDMVYEPFDIQLTEY